MESLKMVLRVVVMLASVTILAPLFAKNPGDVISGCGCNVDRDKPGNYWCIEGKTQNIRDLYSNRLMEGTENEDKVFGEECDQKCKECNYKSGVLKYAPPPAREVATYASRTRPPATAMA